jgi:ElaB/YqjD/DUF883 family membrane-anchored ribosome-binding protein
MANTGNFPQKGDANPSTSRFDTGSMGKTAQEGISAVKDKAQDLASAAQEKVRGAVDVVSERAGEIASNLGQQAQHAAAKVGDTWEAGRHYVEERGVQGMASDVSDLIRRYPLPSILCGVCVGFFIARSMRD